MATTRAGLWRWRELSVVFPAPEYDVTDGKLPASCTTGHSAAAPDLTAACQPNMPAQRYTAIANQDSIDGQDGGHDVRWCSRFQD